MKFEQYFLKIYFITMTSEHKYVSIHPTEGFGYFSSADGVQDGFRNIACELLPKHPLDKEPTVLQQPIIFINGSFFTILLIYLFV